MFLPSTQRFKNGQEHRPWAIVENRRCAGGKIVQRPLLNLGQMNDSQKQAWCQVLEGFDETRGQSRQMALFRWDREIPVQAVDLGIGVRCQDFRLHRPQQWEACWWACELYRQWGLDEFWREKLPPSQEAMVPLGRFQWVEYAGFKVKSSRFAGGHEAEVVQVPKSTGHRPGPLQDSPDRPQSRHRLVVFPHKPGFQKGVL